MNHNNNRSNPRSRNTAGQALQIALTGFVLLLILGGFVFCAKKGCIDLSPVHKTTFPDALPTDPSATTPAAATPAPRVTGLPASIKDLIAEANKDAAAKKKYEAAQQAIEDEDKAIRKSTMDKLADLAMAEGVHLSNRYSGELVVSRPYGVLIRSVWRHDISTDCAMEFIAADKSTKVVDAILLPNGTDVMIPTNDLPRGMDINGRIVGCESGLPLTLDLNFWVKGDENGQRWVAFQRAPEPEAPTK